MSVILNPTSNKENTLMPLNLNAIHYEENTQMSVNFNHKIYFYCFATDSLEKPAYHHAIVCLAEGLKELGVEFYSNVNYWRTSTTAEEYLFEHDPNITPDDCSVVIFDYEWFCHDNPFPDHVFHPQKKYLTVYFELHETMYSLNDKFRQFDFVFRAQYNETLNYSSNIYPWAYALSNRILKETEVVPNFTERNQHLLVNFRVGHPVRNFIKKEFCPRIQNVLPIDETVDSFESSPAEVYHHLQWKQTGKRHYPAYYKRLKESAACAAFGGFFVNPVFGSRHFTSRLLNHLIGRIGLKTNRIIQWDNWRFWESLASGCATFHLDFEKYHFRLPVMPENWRHYIGIDLDNLEESIDKIAKNPEILEKIAVEGRQWAIENYSPVPTAIRFIETISAKLP